MDSNKIKPNIGNGQSTITFPDKPSAAVRTALKRNGFRWSPGGGYWWRRTGSDFAAVFDAIIQLVDREAGVRRPDGTCWKCKEKPGFLRNYGAAAPVYCDECEAKSRAEDCAISAYTDVDSQYEEQCRQQCGL